jgi:hypothetical protein
MRLKCICEEINSDKYYGYQYNKINTTNTTEINPVKANANDYFHIHIFTVNIFLVVCLFANETYY